MRQYRGRIKDSTVWVYGYFTKSPQGIARIWSPITKDNGESYLYDYVVDPETVGQYTGLKDRNGKEIYEGDIIRSKTYLGETLVIKWDNVYTGFYCHDKTDEEENHLNMLEAVESEVIGNIHDNPELLKGLS